MNYTELHAAADGQLGPYCRNCPVCNGKACGIAMPGPGSKYPGTAAPKNFEAWQNVRLKMDTFNANCEPDMSFELFGHMFKTPVFAAPIGGMNLHYGDKYNDYEYNSILLKAAAEYGSLAFTGEAVDHGVMKKAVDDIDALGGIGCPTMKPWGKETLFKKLDYIKSKNVFAVAMDIDAAGLPLLRALNTDAGGKSVEQMKEIIDYAEIPFIIKGIMSVEGAEKAVEAGAAAIVVSNHGGRVFGCGPATAEVLPYIADAVKGKIKIIVDGGIRRGEDVFRALALGADCVLIGRPVVNALYGSAEEGLKILMDKIAYELRDTMFMCGVKSIKEISGANIWSY
ncbi:MAG: alpha-hydroxy-acid oxidizing protein [Eubacteriales bacterium]|nr:alpha-hydroxy-acid oxidizing protein [Eubacteriales bacterium]